MNWQNRKSYAWLFIVLAVLLTSACGNRYVEDIQQQQKQVDQQLSSLKTELDRGSLRNALIVKSYASKLKSIDPSLSEVADVLQSDATSNGTLYRSLEKRAQAVNKNPEKKEAYMAAADELNSIYAASDPIIFNESLIDLVNTLSDLSGGQLSRVNIPKSAATQAAAVPGSYLVGNPSYGQWSNDSSGNSFWSWYGKYAMFSSLMRPVLYGSWYGQPRYSYYHDYGRSSYGSRHDRQSWKRGSDNLRNKGITPSKPKKDYRSNVSKKRQSTYAYAGNKGRQYGAKSGSSRSSGSGGYAKRTSSYGGYSSGFRSNSGSRSFRGGK